MTLRPRPSSFTDQAPRYYITVAAVLITNLQRIYDLIIHHLAMGTAPTAEVLWRLARAARDLSTEMTDANAKKSLIYEVRSVRRHVDDAGL